MNNLRKKKFLWKPDPKKIKCSHLYKFINYINEDLKIEIPKNFNSIWRWSLENSGEFWNKVWNYSGIIGNKGSRLLTNPNLMPGAKFFPDARLNYAENLLFTPDDSLALIYTREDGKQESLTRS